METRRTILNGLAEFLVKIPTAVVSGLPKEKLLNAPENKNIMRSRNIEFRPYSERNFHRPPKKPVVERQTLLKEKKKTKVVH